jgi:outer membrane protein
MKFKSVILAAVAWLSCGYTLVRAVDKPVELTLDNATELALERNYNAKVERLTLIQAEQQVKAQKGRFRTQIEMEIQAPNFQESVQSYRVPNELPYYNTIGNLRWQSNLTVRQPLPTNGSVSLTNRLYQTRESVFQDQLDITDKDKRFLTALRLELRQPLFVPNTLKLGLERANLQHEQAVREYTRTELDVVYTVTESFYSLYRARRTLEIAREEVEQQQEAYNLAQRKYEAGLIPEVSALEMEVDLAQSRNRLLSAEGTLSRREDQFKITIGLPLEQSVTVTTDLEISKFLVNEEKAVEHGLKYRSEIRDREISRRLAEIYLEETDAQSTIRGQITAYYDLTGVSDPLLDYGSSVSRLFRSSLEDLRQRPKNRGITFTLSLPIWDSGVNKAQVAAARARLEESRETEDYIRLTVARDIRAVVTRLEETRGRLEVLKRTEEVALRSYEITQSRFNIGDITSQELANNRDRLTDARQNYLSAFIDYQLAVADLKRNTLYDWENGKSLVGDAG